MNKLCMNRGCFVGKSLFPVRLENGPQSRARPPQVFKRTETSQEPAGEGLFDLSSDPVVLIYYY
jgi:hypothetical protein